MSSLIELEDKYFQDMLVQANRVCSVIQDPELKKQAFALTYEHLLELNADQLDFGNEDEEDEEALEDEEYEEEEEAPMAAPAQVQLQ